MQTIKTSRTISMGHRLPSYKGICSNPHGHNIKVEVTVNSKNGSFLDFKTVDNFLAILLGQMDHAMVLWIDDPLAKVLKEMGFDVYFTREEPTTEHIAKVIYDHMCIQSAEWVVYQVEVFETDKYSARFTG